MSEDLFSLKNLIRRELTELIFNGSLRRELSNLQMNGLLGFVENVREIEIGWWSERIIGSIVTEKTSQDLLGLKRPILA